jgi:hypothetical protein
VLMSSLKILLLVVRVVDADDQRGEGDVGHGLAEVGQRGGEPEES